MKKVAFAVAVLLSLPAVARAVETDPTDCPPGSVNKTENGMTWCEPSVCESDSNCLPNEVCRPIALCVQIGTVAGDAGATANNKSSRLIATGRCAADKKCPSTTTCSDKSRCIEKQKADKMGILTAPTAAPSGGTVAPDAKKSGCGCSTVGERATNRTSLFALAGIGLLVARRRARRR